MSGHFTRGQVTSDEQLVSRLDEFIFDMKSYNSELCLALRADLFAVCKKHGLDWDQHMFARLPQSGLPPKEKSEKLEEDKTTCICGDVDDHGYINLLKYCIVHGSVGKLLVSHKASASACTCVELSQQNTVCPKHRLVFPRPAKVGGVEIEVVALKNKHGF